MAWQQNSKSRFFFGKRFAESTDLIPEDTLLLLEHPPVYTYGRSVRDPRVCIRDYDQFKKRKEKALSIGFSVVIAEPRARTSYRAGEAYRQAREARLREEEYFCE